MGKGKPPIGKRFSATYQPPNAGRKPTKLKEFVKDNGISSVDVSNIIKYVLPLNEGELKEIIDDKSKPMIMRMLVKAIVTDVQNGTVNNLMTLLTRAFGSPKQEIEHSTIGDNGEPAGFKITFGD